MPNIHVYIYLKHAFVSTDWHILLLLSNHQLAPRPCEVSSWRGQEQWHLLAHVSQPIKQHSGQPFLPGASAKCQSPATQLEICSKNLLGANTRAQTLPLLAKPFIFRALHCEMSNKIQHDSQSGLQPRVSALAELALMPTCILGINTWRVC